MAGQDAHQLLQLLSSFHEETSRTLSPLFGVCTAPPPCILLSHSPTRTTNSLSTLSCVRSSPALHLLSHSPTRTTNSLSTPFCVRSPPAVHPQVVHDVPGGARGVPQHGRHSQGQRQPGLPLGMVSAALFSPCSLGLVNAALSPLVHRKPFLIKQKPKPGSR